MSKKHPTEYFTIGPFPVSVAIFTSEKQLKHETKRIGFGGDLEDDIGWKPYGGRVVKLDDEKTDSTLIWVMIDAKNIAKEDLVTRVNIYAHEAVHVYQFLMDSIGEEDPGVEVEAYCIGYVTEKIFSTLEKVIVKS